VVRFAEGAARAAALHACPLLGGDLSRTDGPLVCAVTMFGDVHGARHTRGGAKAGDVVWLSRKTGASAAGLRALQAGLRPQDAQGPHALALRAHLTPTPELPLGQALVGIASACMDVSDGLLLDLSRLAAASGVAINLTGLDEAIDVAAGATAADAYGGGEDWALLFTTAAATAPSAGAIRLGEVMAGTGLWRGGQALAPQGWDHFAG
jgi:thiamine-monophosphate kinase